MLFDVVLTSEEDDCWTTVRSDDVETEDEDSFESAGVDELAHRPSVCCAKLVDSNNVNTKASIRLPR
jgi:hypothetical protein